MENTIHDEIATMNQKFHDTLIELKSTAEAIKDVLAAHDLSNEMYFYEADAIIKFIDFLDYKRQREYTELLRMVHGIPPSRLTQSSLEKQDMNITMQDAVKKSDNILNTLRSLADEVRRKRDYDLKKMFD